jgi:endonuclease/exonuclease/phosphatase (EEP) superfamily protein YafD
MKNPAQVFLHKLFLAGRELFWVFAWCLVSGFFLLYPAHWVFGESIRPVRMSFYVTPWWLLLLLPTLCAAVWARRCWLAAMAVLPTVLVLISILPSSLPKPVSAPARGSLPLKIMTYNTHGIAAMDGIVAVIRHENADILLLQEYAPALVSTSFHGLDDLYPYRDVVEGPYFGQAAFSHYPLQRIAVEFEEGKVQKLSVETSEGPITVWNVHPIPPFLVPPAQFDAQMTALAGSISQTPGPLIVAGDFNATEQSVAYQQINRYLANAYREAGRGMGFSYPAPPYTFMDINVQTGPLWRIDHIFHSREWIATDARTLTKSGGSDHFPALATLFLTK